MDHTTVLQSKDSAQYNIHKSSASSSGRGAKKWRERETGYSNLKFSEKSSHTTRLEAVAKESLSFLINRSEIAFLVQNKERM